MISNTLSAASGTVCQTVDVECISCSTPIYELSIIFFIRLLEALWYLRPSSDDHCHFSIDASCYALYLNAVIIQICKQVLTRELYNRWEWSRSPTVGHDVPLNRVVSALFSYTFWSQQSGSRLMFGCDPYGICTCTTIRLQQPPANGALYCRLARELWICRAQL